MKNGTGKLSGLGGFSLIELLVVIAIIAILAGLLLSATGAASNERKLNRIRSTIAEVSTAIDEYQAARGSYPPSFTNNINRPTLYYELMGTVYDKGSGRYTTLNQRETIPLTDVRTFFGTNATFANAAFKAKDAKNFFPNLGRSGYAEHPDAGGKDIEVLVVPVKSAISDRLVLFYNSRNPTNNPGKYDLWVEWQVDNKKTETIGNW